MTARRALTLLSITLTIAGCNTINPVPTIPFKGNKEWIVAEDQTWRIGTTSTLIVVPAGFVTDYASIPQALWSFGLSPHGKYSQAAIVHDYLYWTQECTREQADNLMAIAMMEEGVNWRTIGAIYFGLRLGGGAAWKANAAEKAAGLPRMVPSELRKLSAADTWSALRERIRATQGPAAHAPPPSSTPDYCQHGNSLEVPNSPIVLP